MKRVRVGLGARSYDIVIGSGVLCEAGRVVCDSGDYTSAVVVTHPGLLQPYAEPVIRQLEALGLRVVLAPAAAGERRKNMTGLARIYQRLADSRLDRKGVIVSVGGGVLGDMAGFAAATWLRGVAHVQIPTTLLAQVDAGIGGKTGIDLPAGKNLVGAFHQPRAVLIDPETLASLPARELRSGMAEVLKYGIIRDESMWVRVVSDLPKLLRRDADSLEYAITRSCEIKAAVVASDETEAGKRAILNFGHTIGHAIEAVTAYRRFRHGEAIAIGMVSAALIGEAVGVTPAGVTREIHMALHRAGLPTRFPSDLDPERVVSTARQDKKSVGGKVRYVLTNRIGHAQPGFDVPDSTVSRCLRDQMEFAPPG